MATRGGGRHSEVVNGDDFGCGAAANLAFITQFVGRRPLGDQ